VFGSVRDASGERYRLQDGCHNPARIFEPFFTTKEVGKGTGLGLATVHGIVNQSGGRIWVYSEPGRGTTFKVYLPAVEGSTAVSTKDIEEDLLLNGSETVLLVEDEEVVRDMVCDMLRESGYEVLVAKDGRDALVVHQGYDGEIHLMLTDVVMPQMTAGAARRLTRCGQ
jgi:hypothetical protein